MCLDLFIYSIIIIVVVGVVVVVIIVVVVRLMEAFSKRLFLHLGPGRPFTSADAAFVLAFSTIMLNTDLHNPQIHDSKRMTKEEFIRNNRGINDKKDIPREYLELLYEEIKTKQIQVDLGIGDDSAGTSDDFTDTANWNKLLNRSAALQDPASFTPRSVFFHSSSGSIPPAQFQQQQQWQHHQRGLSTVGNANHNDRGSGSGRGSDATSTMQYYLSTSAHEKDMFLVMARPVMETLLAGWRLSDDDRTTFRYAS